MIAYIEYIDKRDKKSRSTFKGSYNDYVAWFNSIVKNKENKLIGGSEYED